MRKMYRGAYLNPSNIAFQNVLNDSIYVDKTDLIKFCNERVCTSNKLICCTRPRRFGKSIAIEMLAAYYSKGCDSKELFEGLNVSKYNMESQSEVKLSKKFKEYMNSFDVIFLDIQSVLTKVSDSSKASDFLTKRIKEELAEVYPECVQEDYDLASTLMEINAKENKQFIILIDEWDAIFRLDKYNEEAQRKYMLFLRSIFKGREADSYVAFAYITGILPIKKYNDESSLNNFNEEL